MTAYDKVLDGSIVGETVEYDYGGMAPLKFTVTDVRKNISQVDVDGEPTEIVSYAVQGNGHAYFGVSPNNIKVI